MVYLLTNLESVFYKIHLTIISYRILNIRNKLVIFQNRIKPSAVVENKKNGAVIKSVFKITSKITEECSLYYYSSFSVHPAKPVHLFLAHIKDKLCMLKTLPFAPVFCKLIFYFYS